MVKWILIHLPHLLPPAIAFAFLGRLAVWAADQPPQHFSDEQVEVWTREREARRASRRRPVRAGVARAGLWSLLPLGACFATGLWIYTLNIRDDRPSTAMIWLHVVSSALGLVVVTAKAGALGRARLRQGLSLERVTEAPASVLLLALGLPLLATGAWLVPYPSGSSTTDYVHLVISVWWTLLLQWHVYRYLGRALAVRRPPADGAAR